MTANIHDLIRAFGVSCDRAARAPRMSPAQTAALQLENAARVALTAAVDELAAESIRSSTTTSDYARMLRAAEVRISGLIRYSDEGIAQAQAALQERIALDRANRDLVQRVADLEKERDALRARLAELERQEVDGWVVLTPNGSRLVSEQEAKGRPQAYPVYARPVPAIPDGWRLVPAEPTQEMLAAAARASMQHLIDCINDPARAAEVGSEEMCKRTHGERYKSMLAAAPEAAR